MYIQYNTLLTDVWLKNKMKIERRIKKKGKEDRYDAWEKQRQGKTIKSEERLGNKYTDKRQVVKDYCIQTGEELAQEFEGYWSCLHPVVTTERQWK